MTWKNIDENLVDKVWTDRPEPKHNEVFIQPMKYSGIRSKSFLILSSFSVISNTQIVSDPYLLFLTGAAVRRYS